MKKHFNFKWKIFVTLLFDMIVHNKAQCGGTIPDLHGNRTHIEYPENYAADANCVWGTIARDEDTMFIKFDLLDVESDSNDGCNYDYVSIKFPSEESAEKFCGLASKRSPDKEFKKNGTGNPIIKFVSDDSVQYKGFLFNYIIERFDYCQSTPCENSGTCVLDDDTEDGWVCDCSSGWIGQICDEDLDECLDSPCQHGGTCSTPEFDMHSCKCSEGFIGDNCETDIDECESSPCQNGGSCIDDVNEYSCDCSSGYTGERCETEINECDSNPCENEATCVDQVDGFECECAAGYEGTMCENEINECSSTPCANGATCINLVNAYECKCVQGYEGDRCEKEIDECSSNPCQNSGSCESKIARYVCSCSEGYTGINCQIEIDECDSNPCPNNAHCVDHPGSYECLCQSGYTGPNCATVDEEPTETPNSNEDNNDPIESNGPNTVENNENEGNNDLPGGSGRAQQGDQAYLVAAILPSIVFLLLGITVAALMFAYFRKKKTPHSDVRTIDVKPTKETKVSKKESKSNKSHPKSKEQNEKKKRRHSKSFRYDKDSDVITVIEDDHSLVPLRSTAHIGRLANGITHPLVVTMPTQYPSAQQIMKPSANIFGDMMNRNRIQPGMFPTLPAYNFGYAPQNVQRFPLSHQPYQLPNRNPAYSRTNFSNKLYPEVDDHHRPYKANDTYRPDTYDTYYSDGSEDYSRMTSRASSPSSDRTSKFNHLRHRELTECDTSMSQVESDTNSRLDGRSNYLKNHYNPSETDYRQFDSEEDQRLPSLNKTNNLPGLSQAKPEHWQERDNKKLNRIPTKHKFYEAGCDIDPDVINSLKGLRHPEKLQGSYFRKKRYIPALFPPKQRSSGKLLQYDKEPRHLPKMRREKNLLLPTFPKLQRQPTYIHQKNSNLRGGLKSGGSKRKSQKCNAIRKAVATLTPITEEDSLRQSSKEGSCSRTVPRSTHHFLGKHVFDLRSERHPPEGRISSSDERTEGKNQPRILKGFDRNHEKNKLNSPSALFKLIRNTSSLNVNRGRGLARENAFVQK